MEFYFPTSLGEQLAFGAAVFVIALGLFTMFAPGLTLSLCGLKPREGRNEGFSEARSTGGFYAACGLSAVLLAQDWIYLALGAAFGMAAFGRILSIMSDGANTMRNYLFLVVQILLAALPLAYIFQLV